MEDNPAALAPDEQPTPFVSTTVRQLVTVLVIGLGVGLLVWGLTRLVSVYVATPLLCGDGGQCTSALRYSELAAVIIANGIGLFSLVRLRVYRPLLIVLASAVTAWGIIGYTTVLFPWYGVLMTSALMYIICYVAYTWLARIKLFWVATLLLILVTVAARLILR